MSNNQITNDRVAELFADALIVNKTLTTLKIPDENIFDSGIIPKIQKALDRNKREIEKTKKSSNKPL